MERIYPTKDNILNVIDSYRIINHIERYQIIKRYCFGNVLDIACGVGYGSYLLSNNPDIEHITGVDIDPSAIEHAERHYKSKKIDFEIGSVKSYFFQKDVVVSLETIEHIEDLQSYRDMIYRVNPSLFIVSFPNKRSTHFNPYHKHDLNAQQVVDLMDQYVLVKQIYQHDVSILIMIKKPKKMPDYIFNILI